MCAVAVLAFLLFSTSTSGQEQQVPVIEDTFQAACETLKSELAKVNHQPRPDSDWFCEEADKPDRFIITMALRSSRPNEDGSFSPSNLLGWYAVARKSPLAFEYDINEDRLLPLRPFRS
jgi:hypothetical protein